MKAHYFHWTDPLRLGIQGCALTIGNFDGVHLGHQALLAELRCQADALSRPAVVLTFDPHPRDLLMTTTPPPLLTTMDYRADLLQMAGANHVLVLHTTHDLLELRAKEFFDVVIRDKIQPKAIVPGFNFGFGKNREGDINTLKAYCDEAGMKFDLVQPLQMADLPVSSSRIRGALGKGDVRTAWNLLGRTYRLSGKVCVGQRRGNTIGFPTANLDEVQTMIPGVGVYAVRAVVKGASWAGAANIGPNPTFGEDALKIEIHIIGFDGDIYGETIEIDFLDKLRDTRPFSGVEELKAQLNQDVALAQKVFDGEVSSADLRSEP
ncbi:MAG: bifunctional riboflavin kinase/FAD synthetase [Gemmataceae bacterium]